MRSDREKDYPSNRETKTHAARSIVRAYVRTYAFSRFQSAMYQHLYRYHAYAIIVHSRTYDALVYMHTRVCAARGILND